MIRVVPVCTQNLQKSPLDTLSSLPILWCGYLNNSAKNNPGVYSSFVSV